MSAPGGYGYERRYGLTGYYRRNTDSVTDLIEHVGNAVSLDTMTNLPRNDSGGLELTASAHLVPSLAYRVSGNAFYSQWLVYTFGEQKKNKQSEFDYENTAGG